MKVESIPDAYAKVLEGVRKNSDRKKKSTKVWKHERKGDKIVCEGKTWDQKLRVSKEAKRVLAKGRIQKAVEKLTKE